MSFLAVHRGAHTSLATDQLWLAGDEVTQVARAGELLQRLEQLVVMREAELAAAREAARAEGRAEGRAQALAIEGPRLWDAWDQAARQAGADQQALRQAVVTLALRVVQRIAADLGPESMVAALAEQAAESLAPDGAAVLRVHPDVAAAVRLRVAASPGVLEVKADETLGRWDCAFETPAGRVLAGLPLQLQRLQRALVDSGDGGDGGDDGAGA